VTSTDNIHGTGVLLGTTGVLLRGPSGSGKSVLALLLLDEFAARGEPALLVGDDRVDIEAIGGTLFMHGPKAIAGMIELRGRGIINRSYAMDARVDLVVDLVDAMERMPEEASLVTTLGGVTIARCPVPRAGLIDTGHQLLLIREAMRALGRSPRSAEKTA